MAKKYLFTLMLALAAISAQAQKTYTAKSGFEFPANEIGVSYGGLNLPEFAQVLGGVLGEAFSLGHAKIDKISFTGCFSLEYLRYVNPYIAFGATTSAESFQLSFKDSSDPGKSTLLLLMPTAKASWFRKEHFSMYSKILVGGGLNINDDDTCLLAAFQVSPIAFEAGNSAVRGFAELGIGYQYLLCAGVRYCF